MTDIREQIAQAIEEECDQYEGVETANTAVTIYMSCARIAREFTPTVDGATVDEAVGQMSVALSTIAWYIDEEEAKSGLPDGRWGEIIESARWYCNYGLTTAAQMAKPERGVLPPATVPTSPTVTGGTDDGLREALAALIDEHWDWKAGQTLLCRLKEILAAHPAPTVDEQMCECHPCPGRGNDGHGLTHCAECCFGTGVEADISCPVHGDPAFSKPPVTVTDDMVERAKVAYRAAQVPYCETPMRGIYGVETTCARPLGHKGDHYPITNNTEWDDPMHAALSAALNPEGGVE